MATRVIMKNAYTIDNPRYLVLGGGGKQHFSPTPSQPPINQTSLTRTIPIKKVTKNSGAGMDEKEVRKFVRLQIKKLSAKKGRS